MDVTSTQTSFTALTHAQPLSGNGKSFKCIYETICQDITDGHDSMKGV